MVIDRRLFLIGSMSLFVGTSIRSSDAATNPTLVQLATATSQGLSRVNKIDDIFPLAERWNKAIRPALKAADPSRETDRDKIIDGITGEMKSQAFEAFIRASLPRLAALLQKIPAIFGPLFAFLEASSSSSTATPYQHLLFLDDSVQADISRAFAKFLPVGWNTSIVNQIKSQKPQLGPSIRMP